MAFRFEFYVQYIWSSQQAIEKYLKAILLYNAQRPPLTHSLEGLLKRVRAVKSIQFSITPKSEAFVEDISGLNPVKIRYLSNGFHVEMTDLALLDQAIWELRMYCELLNYSTRDAGKVTSRLKANVQRIKNGKIGSKAYPLLGGELERIFASTTEVRDHLVWNNKYFGGETLDVDGFTSTWSVLEDQAMASLLKDFIPFKDFLPTAEVGPELIFEVTGSDAGGFKARALGPNISVKASDWKDLQTEVVQTAIAQLGPNAPRLLRLIYVKDEFIAASPST